MSNEVYPKIAPRPCGEPCPEQKCKTSCLRRISCAQIACVLCERPIGFDRRYVELLHIGGGLLAPRAHLSCYTAE